MLDLSEKVAAALLQIGAVSFYPENPVTFTSGLRSPVYIDNRRLPFHPEQWAIVIEAFQQLVVSVDFDVIAGIAAGGIPHSAALAYTLKEPSVFIRKQAKAYGKGNQIEGGDITGKRVLLVEDMVTTGGSLLHGVHAIREAGGLVETCLAITSYGFAEAHQTLKDNDIHLNSTVESGVIVQIAVQSGYLTLSAQQMIEDWFDDPQGWAKRHNF